MSKFLIMGIALLLSFSAGLYIFIPEQHGKILPDFSVLQHSASLKPTIEPPKLAEGQSVLGAAGNTEKVQRTDDGRVIVEGTLPPELKKLDVELTKLTAEVQEKQQQIALQVVSTESGGKAERIVQQADQLVAETNKKHGIDTSYIAAILSSSPPITDPELKKIDSKVEAVDKEIQELERRYQQ